MTDVCRRLGELLQEAGAELRIGLRQQGHLPTVERMRAEGASWDEIGKTIGWAGHAVERWYAMETKDTNTPKCHACDAPATRKCVGDDGWKAYCPKHPPELPVKFDMDIDEI